MQSNNFSDTDIFGQALKDYFQGNYKQDIITHISLDETDILPLPYLFRDYDKMPVLEQLALDLSTGKVIDVGCGAGSHSLFLQKKGLEVTALDISPGAIEVCRKRGIQNTIVGDIWSFSAVKFDTILLMMHGIGMAKTLANLDNFLIKLRSLLLPGGQILLDSSDIIYMFEQDEDGGYWIPGNVAYYGEVEFVTEYKGMKSNPFPWLYLDYGRLKSVAEKLNFTVELVREGGHNDYLARLSIDL